MRYLHLLIVLIGVTLAGASGADVLCVNEETGHLLGYPSAGAPVQLDAPRNYPFVLVDDSDRYYQVSDYRGRKGWVDPAVVSPSECVVVRGGMVNVRTGPGTDHAVLFKAQEGVTFAVLQSSNDWTEVRHVTGKTGWIHNDLVWGAR
jgi:SH3-like domain-containing protein